MPSAAQGIVITAPGQLAAGVVDAAAIATDGVDAAEIKANAVGDSEIAAHTTSKITVPVANLSGQTAVANGGTAGSTAAAGFNNLSPLTTRGDILFRDATGNARLAAGAAGTSLKSNGAGTDPTWGSAGIQQSQSAVQTTVVSTTTETNIMSFSLGGALLGTAGVLHVRVFVNHQNVPAGGSTTLRAYYGTTSIATSAVVWGDHLMRGYIDFFICANAATNVQRLIMSRQMWKDQTDNDLPTKNINGYHTGTAAEDSTGALTVKITAQFSLSDSTNKIITDGYVADIL